MKLRIAALASVALFLLACNNPRSTVTFTPSGDPQIDSLSLKIVASANDAALYHARAQRFIELKKPDQALADINQAISLEPENVAYRLALSDAFFQLGKITESRKVLEQVWAGNQGNIEVALKLAEISLYFKEYDKTALYLDEAEHADKRDPRIHFMRGFMYKDKGDTLAAVSSFYKTVEYDSAHYDAYLQLGILYAAKHSPLAIEFYRHANRVRPASIEPLYNLGMYYQQKNDLNAAIQAYTDALAINPKFKYAHFALGYIHIELKIYSEAARHFTNAILSDPAYVEGYYGRAYALEQMGDVMNAKADYAKCLQLSSNHPGAIEGLRRIDRLPPLDNQ